MPNIFEKILSIFTTVGDTDRNIKPVVLIILDGWGIAPPSHGNVLSQAKIPNLEKYLSLYPHTELIASGESVGLPANEVGNTEVGHLTIGAGRVVYQGLKRINVAIEDGTFFRNKAFQQVAEHVKKNNSKLHILGVLSSGNVHASLPHFYSLLQVCEQLGCNNVFVHAFTDGRDAPPKEAQEVLAEVEKRMLAIGVGQIASVSGRYYAMDRDRRWERIERAYQAIVEGKGRTAESYQEAIQSAYSRGTSDELVEPTVIMKNGAPVATIDDNDGVIFLNFRVDRPRELTMALTLPDFENVNLVDFGFGQEGEKIEGKDRFTATFTRAKKPQNMFVVSMMNYHKNIPVNAIAFDSENLEQSLPEVMASTGMLQLHMAESEKERFVTYYLDGYHEQGFPGEDKVIVPSPKVPTYDKKPEMSVAELAEEFKKYLALDKYHFFAMNIANPDMVAHTGNIQATIKACEAVDKALGEIVDEVLGINGTVFITADHGNAEELLTYPSSSFFFTSSGGSVNTDHSNNPVPLIIIDNTLVQSPRTMEKGALSDIAPTVLTWVGFPVPPQMTGRNLLR